MRVITAQISLLIAALLGVALADEPAPPAVPPAAPPTAQAAGPALDWQWNDGVGRRFWIQTSLVLPEPLLMLAAANDEARLVRLDMQVLTRCESVEAAPSGWRLLCLIEDISLSGDALPADKGKLDAILREADAALSVAGVELGVRRDGRLSSLRLVGLDSRDRRRSRQTQTLEMLVERAFLGLELHLPATWSGGWSEPTSGLMTYLPRAQSQGAGRLLHDAVDLSDPTKLRFESEGRAVTQATSLQSRQERGAPGDLSIALAEAGDEVFDAKAGTLVERRWAIYGRPTASTALPSPADRNGASGAYTQSGVLRLLDDDAPRPTLPASGERESSETANEAATFMDQQRGGLSDILGGDRVEFNP